MKVFEGACLLYFYPKDMHASLKKLYYFLQALLVIFLVLHAANLKAQTISVAAPSASNKASIPGIFSSKPYVEVGLSFDHLTNQYASWRGQAIDVFMPLQNRGLIYIQALRAERYDQEDNSIYGGYSYPTQWGILATELGHASAPHFLSEHLYGLTWTGYSSYGFNYLLGSKQTQYTDSRTAADSLGLETYLGDWRLAYVATHSDLNHIRSGWVNKYQLQWLGTINRLGLTYALGDEPTVLSPNNLVNTQVETIQLDGVYAFNKTYALTGVLWHTKQGHFYQRNGIQFGLRVSY